jgi:red chlorophyll catabolite reductase
MVDQIQSGSTGSRLMEFPHLIVPHKEVMVSLISKLETRLDSQLLPCSATVPPDVEYYQNLTGSSQGTLSIRRGIPSSPIDFILASWLKLALPNGSSMNITNLQGYLKPSTDAPHFQFELAQCSDTFFILFLDLIPRKDLVLHQEYLKTFYKNNNLESLRQKLAKVHEIKPYFSSSLNLRRATSPTASLVSFRCDKDKGGIERVEEIIRDEIGPVAIELLELWMEKCVLDEGRKNLSGEEKSALEKRDGIIKSNAIEMDLSNSMPLQFGDEVANKVLSVIRGAFNV